MQNHQTVSLVIIDDDIVDIKVFQRSLKRQRISNPLFIAHDGIEGLELLQSPELKKPYLILLDINMPRMGGIEFLQELRKLPEHRDAIVFVMTTSDDEKDKFSAYKLNVAGYMVKTDLGESFLDAIDLLDRYWKTIQLPC